MSKQEVFNKVAKHLLAQRERSENATRCLYLDPAGNRCAVGILLSEEDCKRFDNPDDHPELSKKLAAANIPNSCGLGVTEIVMLAPEALGDAAKYERLLMDLQRMHDQEPPSMWEESLVELANDYSLEMV